jgi:tRNA G18 (ribose-2'-O)-methylase SpoU
LRVAALCGSLAPVPTILTIDEADDPRIAAYRDIRERDLVGRQGLFVAEGEVVLRVLLARSRFPVRSLLIAETRLAALEPLLASLPPSIPVHVARQDVLDGIAGFNMHRGILAIGERGNAASPSELLAGLGAPSLVAVLCGIANHDNMGGIFRNAAAFGVDAVLVDADSVDPLYRKAIRVSVGAALFVPFARVDRGTDIPALLAAHGFEALSLTPRGTIALADIDHRQRRAVLFGSEGDGLPDPILARTRTVRIPMAPGFDSLNVATASGIVFHHLRAIGERA